MPSDYIRRGLSVYSDASFLIDYLSEQVVDQPQDHILPVEAWNVLGDRVSRINAKSRGLDIGWEIELPVGFFYDVKMVTTKVLPTVVHLREKVARLIEQPAHPEFIRLTILLHPDIKLQPYTLFLGGHYREAIVGACDVVTDALRRMSGRRDDGKVLAEQTFGSRGTHTFAVGEDDTSKSKREGWSSMLRGFYAAIRNVHTHSRDEGVTAAEAGRMLVLASILLNAITSAVPVVTPFRTERDELPSTSSSTPKAT